MKRRSLLLSAMVACSEVPAPAPPTQDLAAHVHDLAEPEEDLAPPMVTGPELLSETGLYADLARRQLAPGVVAFAPRFQLWSDGSEKERFLLLPPGARIDTRDMDGWIFPVGTKVWKHFRAGGRLVETRLLWKVLPGVGERGWWRVAYVWDEAGTEARAAPGGMRDALGTSHDVPGQKDCDRCHRGAADVLLGVAALQLSAPDGAGLLSQLAQAGRLSDPPPGEYQPPGSGVEREALGYLHGNCGVCHNPRYPIKEVRRIQFDLIVGDTTPEHTGVYQTAIGAPLLHVLPDGQTQVLVPGDPARSGLLGRMRFRDGGVWQMPPVGSERVDERGAALVEQRIASLPRHQAARAP